MKNPCYLTCPILIKSRFSFLRACRIHRFHQGGFPVTEFCANGAKFLFRYFTISYFTLFVVKLSREKLFFFTNGGLVRESLSCKNFSKLPFRESLFRRILSKFTIHESLSQEIYNSKFQIIFQAP